MKITEALEALNIDKETFDAIIGDKDAKKQIVECLLYCLENVEGLREIASAAVQYIVCGENFETDGGPGSGNFGHEGVPGQVGGSAPSGKGLNSKLSEAHDAGRGEYNKAVREVLSDVPVGTKFKHTGMTYTKTSDDKWTDETGYEFGSEDVASYCFNYLGANFYPAEFEDVSSEEIAEQKVASGDISPEDAPDLDTASAIADYQNYGYKAVNEALRSGKKPEGKAAFIDEGLSRAFEEAEPTQESRTVMRDSGMAVTSEAFSKLNSEILNKASTHDLQEAWNTPQIREEIKGSLIGYQFEEKGYMSCSSDHDAFVDFSNGNGAENYFSSYGCKETMRVQIPKGSKVLDLGDDGYIAGSGEHEVILNKGGKYTITDVDYDFETQSLSLWCNYEAPSRQDGGPGSGNYGHAGVPGQVGGSAPSGSAGCEKTTEKLKSVKEKFAELEPYQKAVYLSESGIFSKDAANVLKNGAENEDELSIRLLDKYSKQYFEDAEYGAKPKDLKVEMRDDVQQMTDEERREWVSNAIQADIPDSLNKESKAQKVAYAMAMNETPQVVSHEDFDAFVEETGAKVIYRGVKDNEKMSAAEMRYQMAYDTQNPYLGDGVFGDGLYFSDRKGTAESYGGDGVVSKCALRPDAKVMEYPRDVNGNYEIPKETLAKWRAATGTDDVAVNAMCQGYDAIRVPQGNNEVFTVVLNRAALIMEDPLDDPEWSFHEAILDM